MNEIKERKSNYELLRIISIILIIAHHYSVHGNWSNKIVGLSFNNIFIDFLAIGGKLGVICFVLIAGYFGISSKFSIKKIIKLILQVVFYTITFVIVFNVFSTGKINMNWTALIKSIFPVTFEMYWFITVYVVLYIVSPFINKLISNISKEEYQKLLIILILITFIIPTFTTRKLELGNVDLFICIYMIGAYIRLYLKEYKDIKTSLIVFIISYLLMFISQIAFEILGNYYSIFEHNINYFTGLNSILILVAAISLFMVFKSLKIQNKFINYVAKAVFGVYIIHDNYFVKKFLWEILFNNNKYYSSNYLILHAIVSVSIVYIACTIIDLIRIYAIERKVLPSIYKCYDNVKIRINDILMRKKVK